MSFKAAQRTVHRIGNIENWLNHTSLENRRIRLLDVQDQVCPILFALLFPLAHSKRFGLQILFRILLYTASISTAHAVVKLRAAHSSDKKHAYMSHKTCIRLQ